MPDDTTPPAPGPTPNGYQRTSGGGFKWQPPTAEHLSTLLPQYEVEALIGRGGMGAVYKGRQKSLDRPVAIKILPPEVDDEDATYTERFKNEAKVMARFTHPAIVAVHDFGETSDGQLYFIMEFVDGTDVQQMLETQGRLPPEHALAITAHVCDALKYAHEHGVIHRDIKPGNVLINLEGAVKVADFGLAKQSEAGSSGLTQSGMTMGTPDFVAPEALILGAEVDGRADLYAVGVMLYNMLTGKVPRGAFKPASALVPGLDPRFDKIATKAMQHEREDRYQTAAEIRRDLDAILATPLAKSGSPTGAVLPKQSLPQKPVSKGPQKPVGKSANVPVRQGISAKVAPRGQAPVSPGPADRAATAKSRTPLFVGIGAAAVVTVAGFVFRSGDRKDSGDRPRSAASVAHAPASSATKGSTPIKVRENPKPNKTPDANAGAKKAATSSPPPAAKPVPTTPAVATKAPTPPAKTDEKPRWQKVEWTQEQLKTQNPTDTIQIEDGWYHIKTSTFRFPSPAKPPKNIAVRYRARKGGALFKLKSSLSGGNAQHFLTAGENGVEIVRYDSSKEGALRSIVLTQAKLPAVLAAGSEAVVEFAVIGNRYGGRINNSVTEWAADEEGAGSRTLVFQNMPGAEAWIKDVEFIVLDGLSETEAKQLLGWDALKAQPLAGENPVSTPPAGPQPARMPDPTKWVRVFDTPESLGKRNGAEWTENGIHVSTLIHATNNELTDAAVRATVRTGLKSTLKLRSTSERAINATVDSGKIVIGKSGAVPVTLAEISFDVTRAKNQEIELVFAAVGKVLAVSVDGRLLRTIEDTADPYRGLVSIHSSDGFFRDIAWQSLEARNAADERIATLEGAFLDRVNREVDAPFHAAVGDLAKKLQAAIARAAPTVRGSPAEAALRADIDRLTKQQPLPPATEPKTPPVLATLRKTWHTELDKLRAQRATKAAPLIKAHDEALAALEKEMTDKGDLNRAEKIKAARAVLASPDALPKLVGLASIPAKPLLERPTKGGRLKMIGCFGNAGLPADAEPFSKFDDFVEVLVNDYTVAALRADGSAVIQRKVGAQLDTIVHTSPPLTKLTAYHSAVWGLTEDGRPVQPGAGGKPSAGPWDGMSGLIDFSCGDSRKYCAGLKADGTVVLAWATTADITWLPKAETLPKAKAVVCNNNDLIILTEAGGLMAWHISGAEVKVPQELRRGIAFWHNPSLNKPTQDASVLIAGTFVDRQANVVRGAVTTKDVEAIVGYGSAFAYLQKRKGWTISGQDSYGEMKKAMEVLAARTPSSWGLVNAGLNPATGGGTTGIFAWIE